MEQNKNNKVQVPRIPLRKRFWYSITKFEKYPEMAAGGTGKAIGYLAWLMLIFAIIIAIGLLIKFNMTAKEGIKYLNENFSEINYKDGELLIQTTQKEFVSDFGRVIINTDELTSEQLKEYENSTSNNAEFIWLKDKVIVKYNSNAFGMNYKDVLNGFGLQQFDKQQLISFLNSQINSPQIYIIYGIAMIIYVFIAYLLATIIDILVLSFFGWITTLIAQIKIRYRAVFNMSIYAITLSTVLQLIYILIKTFTDFDIKYFDLMYTTISFICLAAAIFMIRSDVIKQQIELMRIIEIKRQEQEQERQDEEKEEKPEEKKEEEKQDEKKEDKKEDKENKKSGQVGGDIEAV